MNIVTCNLLSTACEWDVQPLTITFDIEPLLPLIQKAQTLLVELDSSDCVSLHPLPAFEYGFFDEEGKPFDMDADCNVTWEGPELVVDSVGCTHLVWHSKHTDDKLWSEDYLVGMQS